MKGRPLLERAGRALIELAGGDVEASARARAGAVPDVAGTAVARPAASPGPAIRARGAGGRRQTPALIVPGGRSAWKAAEVTRLTLDWRAGLSSPDDEIAAAIRVLRARARELERNNAYAGRYLELLIANVLGPQGMKLQAQVRLPNGELDQRVNEAIESAWATWIEEEPATLDETMSFQQFEELQISTFARDGEALTRLHTRPEFAFGLALQGVDADLLDDSYTTRPADPIEPEIRMGVEMAPTGRRLGYWVLDEPYAPGARHRGRYRLPAAEVLHHHRPRRASASRGVTLLARAMYPLMQLGGYTEAELVAARGAAAKMGFLTRKDEDLAVDVGADEQAGTETAQAVPMEASPGSIEELPAGMEFQAWDPTHPTTAYADFVRAILREVAVALGVSYEALTTDLENVNYSSIRSGTLVEREMWRILQRWWAWSYRRPVYRAWLRSSLLSGALELPEQDWRLYTAVRWVPRGWAWVDPESDANAAEKALRLRLTSRRRLLAEQGVDFAELLEEIRDDEALAEREDVELDVPAPGAAAAGGGEALPS